MRAFGTILGIVQIGRQHGDVAGDFAEAEILHQHLAELVQRGFLILAVHRCAGIDDEAQRGMIVFVDRGVLDHHLQNGRHGEDVADAMKLDQAERLGNVEFFRRQQDGRHAARGLHQLMHAGAMRQRRHHQRGVLFGGAGHQVGEMVGDDKGHLAVGQHRRLGASRGAGGEEEPAGVVVVDRGVLDLGAGMGSDRRAYGDLAEGPLADPPDEFERGIGGGHRVIGKIAVAQERSGAGGGREPGHFVRHQAEVGRHPDRAQTKGCEHRPEHLVAVLRVDQDAVALADAARAQCRRQRRHRSIDLAPGPGPVAPDEALAVAMPPCVLGQEMGQIHHPARHPRQPAARRGHRHGLAHWTPATPAARALHKTITLRMTDMITTIAESRPPASVRPSPNRISPSCPPDAGTRIRQRRATSAESGRSKATTGRPSSDRPPAAIADVWRDPDRSGASPATTEARPARQRLRRERHART